MTRRQRSHDIISGGEVFSLTVRACASSFKRSWPGITSLLASARRGKERGSTGIHIRRFGGYSVQSRQVPVWDPASNKNPGWGYLSSLALSFSSPIFSNKRLLKIAARPSWSGGEVFSLTVRACASSWPVLARHSLIIGICPQIWRALIRDGFTVLIGVVVPGQEHWAHILVQVSQLAQNWAFNISTKAFAEGIFWAPASVNVWGARPSVVWSSWSDIITLDYWHPTTLGPKLDSD